MPRTINAATGTALDSNVKRVAVFAELDFPGGMVRAWSGYGDQDLNGDTYLGVGTLGSISAVSEEESISASNVIVQLNGVPSELLSLVLQEDYQGRAATFYRALFDETGLIGDAMTAFSGRMDVATIDDGKDSGVISISIESRLVDFNRPRLRRYTHEDQKARFPNDQGFLYVAGLQQKELPWGRSSNNVNGSSAGGREAIDSFKDQQSQLGY